MRNTTKLMLTAGFAATSGLAGAQVITVNTASDTVDFSGAQQVADLPGPDGVVSLREAALASDNTPGVQTVGFDVPQGEWAFQFIYPGRAVLNPFLLRFFEPVIIDGTTQTAATGDTNPDGAEVVIMSGLITIGDDTTIRGIDSSAISVNGSNNTVELNTGFTSISLFGGSGSTIRNNTITGTIKLDRSNDNTVVGNVCQRVRIQGFVSEFGTGPITGTRVGGPNPEDRNYITGYGTWNSEGLPSGTTVEVFDNQDTVIENNWIGTPDGLTRGNDASSIGVGFYGTNSGVLVKDNLISGILGVGMGPHYAGTLWGRGIYITGTGGDINIMGNTIGLDINGQPTLGSVYGIDVDDYPVTSVHGVTIGDASTGQGNTIAGHRFNGISVNWNVSAVTISGNSIYANDDLGIDLFELDVTPFGVTANDAQDADTGGNNLQNYPVLSSAEASPTQITIAGTLNSTPNATFTVELFASSVCNDSGFGEGERYLGQTTLQTNGSGDASFSVALPGEIEAGWVATATATDSEGNTSEFSACLSVTQGSGNCIADTNGDGMLSPADFSAWVSAFNTMSPACDQNGDGACSPADFSAWVANYNAGC
ncbi:MAG: hypothetical protein KDA31_08305 [Phycisphaerales bacterium]|nr:hypothetical protein [Phycisphaerales bacterium]MCB9835912.1 hypothetical protein [Phycisphaera sp.]